MPLLLDLNELAGLYTGKIVTVAGVFRATLPANSTFHPYTADHPTPSSGYVFVSRGNGSFTFDDTAYVLHPGKVLHGGKQMSITMHTGDSELEYVLVRYATQDADPSVRSGLLTDDHFALEPGFNPKLTELLSQLYESFYTPGPMAQIRTGYLFQMLLHELLTTCLNRLNGSSKEMIEEARAYIHRHYMEPLSLQLIAERHGSSAKSFSYYFKKYTGVFPIDYLIQHRMKRAQELLTIGHCTIKQVAESVGYEDALYFSRLYKKHYGYAPSQSLRD